MNPDLWGPPNPALWDAAMLGQTEEVVRLLADGADVQEENPTGHSALHIAVLQRRGGIVRLLLDGGADVNVHAANDGATPLHCGAEPGHGDGPNAAGKRRRFQPQDQVRRHGFAHRHWSGPQRHSAAAAGPGKPSTEAETWNLKPHTLNPEP